MEPSASTYRPPPATPPARPAWPAAAISAGMHGFLRSQGHLNQALSLHRAALDAAREIRDPLAEASALTDLGDNRAWPRATPPPSGYLSQAADLYHADTVTTSARPTPSTSWVSCNTRRGPIRRPP